jgi:hypothetical protein
MNMSDVESHNVSDWAVGLFPQAKVFLAFAPEQPRSVVPARS